ncbi:RluA family pseudouridine synthase [uncultured Maricaulis sp.]|uniref:RluA family pseudouridine synthase n=1 Tax=uncultured Maricaulis sp. TaxID=174710 RepID=UPI0030DA769F|tara:strand:+ start:19418 stop:20410 length:993 start_codon:yes stop_codon:yes gene_type:complete
MSGVQLLTVDQGEDGSRLDRWFKRRFPHVGQGLIQKLCRKGDIRVDGRRAKTDLRVEMGMEIRVPPLPEPGEVEKIDVLTPEEIHYVRGLVIYEDDELIAFNKPSGLAVQGGSKTTKHLDRLLDAFGEGMTRPRLVHRLDKDTSGVLVVGRTPKATARLAKAFQQHRTKKTYWAIAIGVPKPRMGEIKGFLKKAAGAGGDPDRELMVGASHGDPGSHHALTRYTVIADAGQKASWVALRPVTGRTHQLRVHLAAMGTAILGDRKYTCDRPAPEDLGQRLCLHARRLEIPRDNGNPLVIEADLPKPLAKVFDTLGFNPREIDEAEIEDQLA